MGKLLKIYVMPHPPIMVHEVGKGGEKDIESTVNSAIQVSEEIGKMKPDTVIILVPPHGPAFSDAMSINTDETLYGDLKRFDAGDVSLEFKTDRELADLILHHSAQNGIPIAPIDAESAKRYRIPKNLDHGSIVPLYFVRKNYDSFKLIHITYGLLSNEELYHFGRIIRDAVEESSKNVVFIASGDLSHRLTHDAPAGYNPKGKDFDKAIVEYLKGPDSDEILNIDTELLEAAGECGYRSIVTALGVMDGLSVESEIYSYEGPFGVGYCIAGYDVKGEGETKVQGYYDKKKSRLDAIRKSEDEYVRLARASLEHFIKNGSTLDVPGDLTAEMLQGKAGVFVSLKKDNQLKGCIGTIEGVQQNIAEEIIENAISAGTRDPRFYPVEEEELDDIVYSVDVLGRPESIQSKEQLDPKRYGVIVRIGRRSGLLLPNLEGVDTVDEQISIALKKAGIDDNEDYSMERFEVIRHR